MPAPSHGSPQPIPAALGEYARRLATGAAAVVRAADARQIADVSTKSTSTDLVTAVDRASERWLVQRILADRPTDAVLGEEGGERAGSSGVRWVLDPIDGTVNFVLGLPHYAISVAAELDGRVVAGAVCNPVTQEAFHAVVGAGAWLTTPAGTQRLRGPRSVPLERAVIGTGFAYDRTVRSRQGLVAAALLAEVADIRRQGSAALDLCSVAAGRLDAYYEVGLNPWDYSAGALIATEAGCVVTGLRGAPISGRIAVAAPTHLLDDLSALLERLGADEVS